MTQHRQLEEPFRIRLLVDGKTAWLNWKKASASARKAHGDWAANCYWWAVGTHGEREEKVVGQGKNVSPITPVSWVTDGKEVTPEYLDKVFIGQALLKQHSDLRVAAKEWLEAYSNLNNAKENSGETTQGAPATKSSFNKAKFLAGEE